MSLNTDYVYQTSIQYAISGNRLSCNLYHYQNTVVSAAPSQALCTAVVTTLIPQFKACTSQDVHFQQVYTRAIIKETSNPYSQPLTDQSGTLQYDSIPSNIPAVIRLYQLETGGRHNGRIFLSGVSENDVTDSYITDAAYTGHWSTLLANLGATLTNGAGDVWWPCVLEKVRNGLPITPVAYAVQEVILNRALASMRRRTTELREYHQ